MSLVFGYSVSQPGHDTFGSFDQDLGSGNPEGVSFKLKCPDLLEKTEVGRNVIDVVVLEVNFTKKLNINVIRGSTFEKGLQPTDLSAPKR